MSIHIIKLVVGCDTLEEFAERCRVDVIDYNGQPAIPCWTRFMPKRADEILSGEGSIYRVIKNRVVCRMKILGFEMVETAEKGKMCMIMQSPRIIQTMSKPRRPFQGWRYLEPSKAPGDKGVFTAAEEEIPADIEAGLREAGLI